MKELMLALVAWMSTNTPFDPPADAPLPSVAVEEQRVLEYMAEVPGMGIMALYEREANRIWLSSEVDLTTVRGKSTMLHELIHWAQEYAPSGRFYECDGLKEFEAHAIQEEYQEAHGIESTIPWMKVYTFYRCPPPFAPGAK